jgi:hypothetical protein
LAAVGAVLVAWIATTAALPAESKTKPTVALAAETPLVVAGRGFKAGERVTVVAKVARGAFRKKVSAGTGGRFKARFAAADASCSPLYVTAVGRQGSRASLRRIRVPPPCGADPS